MDLKEHRGVRSQGLTDSHESRVLRLRGRAAFCLSEIGRDLDLGNVIVWKNEYFLLTKCLAREKQGWGINSAVKGEGQVPDFIKRIKS